VLIPSACADEDPLDYDSGQKEQGGDGPVEEDPSPVAENPPGAVQAEPGDGPGLANPGGGRDAVPPDPGGSGDETVPDPQMDAGDPEMIGDTGRADGVGSGVEGGLDTAS
jgi:hypothetical protein